MVTITKPVGRGVKGTPRDVEVVEGLLRRAGLLPAIGPVAEQELNAAIRTFQKAAGCPVDGRIDPGGHTLRLLNALLEPLKIQSIRPAKIDHGGYRIAVEPFIPGAPYKVWLGFSPLEVECVDITGCKKEQVLDKERLGKLLAIIKRLEKWGTTMLLKVYVRIEDKSLTTSAPACLLRPVHPHNGQLLPLDETNNGPKLKYLGDSPHGPFYGRMLEELSPGMYLFKYGGILETDPAKRGFDCVTYCGTVCGASTSHMAEASDLAHHLGASPVEFEVEEATAPKAPAGQPPKMKQVKLEHAEPALVKKFFETNRPGRYILWSGGHVVLVVNNTVYEFAYSKGGYAATEVKSWLEPYKNMHLTVRKL